MGASEVSSTLAATRRLSASSPSLVLGLLGSPILQMHHDLQNQRKLGEALYKDFLGMEELTATLQEKESLERRYWQVEKQLARCRREKRELEEDIEDLKELREKDQLLLRTRRQKEKEEEMEKEEDESSLLSLLLESREETKVSQFKIKELIKEKVKMKALHEVELQMARARAEELTAECQELKKTFCQQRDRLASLRCKRMSSAEQEYSGTNLQTSLLLADDDSQVFFDDLNGNLHECCLKEPDTEEEGVDDEQQLIKREEEGGGNSLVRRIWRMICCCFRCSFVKEAEAKKPPLIVSRKPLCPPQ